MNEELQRRDDPAAPPDEDTAKQNGLQPGAGKPLVEGPPMSVSEPVSDETINRFALRAGLVMLAVGAVVVLIVVIGLIALLLRH
jgi:Family of unknown function (DUF6480)